MSWTKVTNPNTNNWTKTTNPASGATTINVGNPIGLLLALTYASSSSFVNDHWNKTTNPTVNNWTKVTNPS